MSVHCCKCKKLESEHWCICNECWDLFQQQAEQIAKLQNSALYHENKRLKELIANGSPYIDEEWDNAHSFGLPSFVKWLEDMQAEIKAAQPQKEVNDVKS